MAHPHQLPAAALLAQSLDLVASAAAPLEPLRQRARVHHGDECVCVRHGPSFPPTLQLFSRGLLLPWPGCRQFDVVVERHLSAPSYYSQGGCLGSWLIVEDELAMPSVGHGDQVAGFRLALSKSRASLDVI